MEKYICDVRKLDGGCDGFRIEGIRCLECFVVKVMVFGFEFFENGLGLYILDGINFYLCIYFDVFWLVCVDFVYNVCLGI